MASKRRCVRPAASTDEIDDQVLLSVRAVCTSGPKALRLPHVVEELHALLDWSKEVSLSRACSANFELLVRQKLATWSFEPANGILMDQRFRQWLFDGAVTGAVTCGNLAMVNRLSENFTGCALPASALREGARHGRTEILQWVADHRSDARWEEQVVSGALAGGHFELARWVKERVEITRPQTLSLWAGCIATRGNINMLEWVCSFSQEWDPLVALEAAVDNGHLAVIKWILLEYKPDTFNAPCPQLCLDIAIAAGHFEVLEWVVEHYARHCEVFIGDMEAARKGRLDVVRLLHENHVAGCSKGSIRQAAGQGHLSIVKCLSDCSHTDGYYPGAIDSAACKGFLDIVQWLHTNTSEGCTAAAIDHAALNGHLETVKWLHANRTEGCTTEAMDGAAFSGNLELLQWLHSNTTEGCTTRAMDAAASCGHLDVVKWLHENRSEGCTTDAMDSAARFGHLEVVKFLHANRSEGCTVEAMDGAARFGHLDVVQWLHANRTEGCTTHAIDDASIGGHGDVYEWLTLNRTEGATAAAVTSAVERGDIEELYWWYLIGPAPIDRSALEAAVLNGHFDMVLFFHQEFFMGLQRSEFDVVQVLRESGDTDRRWEFAEWMYEHHREALEPLAASLLSD